MGKKKSIVLMVLLTIVIVVLCAITVVPSFAIPGTVKNWNPVVSQYDLGTDLGGGYYAYYYPTGVISEAEYKNLEDQDKSSYVAHGGLYLNNDPELGIVAENGKVRQEFADNFAKVTAEITARYAAKGYSDYRVAVVDDYALRVQIPSSEATEQQTAFQNAYNTFGLFAETSALEIKKGDALVDERTDNEVDEIIKSFAVKKKQGVAYIEVKFTDVGKEMVKSYRENAETATESEDKLKLMLGEQTIMEIDGANHVTTKNVVQYPIAYESEIGYVETMVILLNSALENGGFDIEFNEISNSQVRAYGAVYGEKTSALVYIAVAAVVVLMIAIAVGMMGGFGVASSYSTVSYLVIVAICYAFVTKGVFEITLGSVLVFLLGLVLVNVFNMHVYKAIKTEFSLGKTVESSVKSGYKKTLMEMVDVWSVLLLGSVALLIGTAGLHTLALQAILCVVTGAFCSLLWTRVISAMLMSASKNKYKYFRLVREEDDDE